MFLFVLPIFSLCNTNGESAVTATFPFTACAAECTATRCSHAFGAAATV